MNTDTGRIYDLDALYAADADRARLEGMQAMATQMYPPPTPRAYSDPLDELTADEQRAEFERALVARDVVPITPQVVQTLRLGQRERERRTRRRRAAKAARKAQR